MKLRQLVEDADRLISEITAILESKQAHPLLNQMANPERPGDPQLLEGTTVNFSRSLIRLAWMLQPCSQWQGKYKRS